VAIKELFVDGSTRYGTDVLAPSAFGTQAFGEIKQRFLEEARALAGFNDSGIVRVLNFFEANNTAYLVMELLEGQTLGAQIEASGVLDAASAQNVAVAMAQTLTTLHASGLLHRDIKPDNIFLEKSGRIVLIDFGSIRMFVPGKTISQTRLVTPGYAPLEQYSSAAQFGPYTDIYALGATLHHALTGKIPPNATDLILGTPLPPLPAPTPAALQSAVEQAMAIKVAGRPQTTQAFLDLLNSPPPQPSPAPPDALGPYLLQQKLTESEFLSGLHGGTLNPSQLPSDVKQVLIQKQWLDAAGQVPDHLRPLGAQPVVLPSPAEILSAYLNKQGLTALQLQNQLYEEYVSPDQLPGDVRQVLIQKRWLDRQGEVPSSLRRPLPPPAPSAFQTKLSQQLALKSYLRTRDMSEDQLQTWLYDGRHKPQDLPQDIRQILISKGWLDRKGKVPKKSPFTTTPFVPVSPHRTVRPHPFASKKNISFFRRSRRPFHTALNWSVSLGGMVFYALNMAHGRPVTEAVWDSVVGASLGVTGGYLLSELLWWSLPIFLPILAAYGAYFFAQRAHLLPIYAIGLSAAAAALSLGFVKAVHRL